MADNYSVRCSIRV